MEQAFGANFGSVRIHTDSQSDQLNRSINAQAFTTKSDIFFSKGKYDPGSRSGQELLAHELTHVVQQTGGAIHRKVDNLSKFQTNFTILTTHHELRHIQKQVAAYNAIKPGSLDYGDQINYLTEIENYAETWIEKHTKKGDVQKNEYTQDVNQIWYEAVAERTRVKQQQKGKVSGMEGDRGRDLLDDGINTLSSVGGLYSAYEPAEQGVRLVKANSVFAEAKKIVGEVDLASQQELAKAAAGSWLDKLIGGAKQFLGFLDSVGILPVIKMIMACTTFFGALGDYRSLDKAAESLKNQPKPDLNLAEAVSHGLGKVYRRVWSAGYDFVKSIIDTVMSIATLVSGGTAAPAKAIASIAGGVLDGIALVYRKVKGLWKTLTGKRGKHRQQSAERIVNSALDGDAVALQLLIDLSPIGLMERLKRFVLPWKKSAPPKVSSPEGMRQLLFDFRRSPAEMGIGIPEFMGLVKDQLKSVA
jgi:Domain of unknown function (DUF4157)